MMNETRKLNNIPENWTWTKLGDIAHTTSGGTPRRTKKAYYNGDIPWLKSGELNDDVIYSTEESITQEGLANSSAKIFPKGTLLIALYGATAGKLAFLGMEAATNQAVCAVFVDENISQKYIYWYLRNITTDLLSKRIGGAQPNLSQRIVNDVSIPIPPYSEQVRIVSKLEELFSKQDAAVKSLHRTKAQLERYRQSLIRYALEGKLTVEWRQNYKQKIEPATFLLKRIKKERRKEDKGKNETLSPVDTLDLPKLPENWTWTRLGDVCDSIEKVDPRNEPNSQFKYLEISSIDNKRNKITKSRTVIGKTAPSRARQQVKKGDILFSTVRTYLRNIAMVDESHDGQVASTGFCVIRPSKPISKNWVFYVTLSDCFVNQLTQLQRGTSYPAVVYSDVFAQIIPLPPVSEQYCIVEELESFFSVIDEAERVVRRSLMQSVRLRQSILNKAFEGRLVPQNPSDEPASKLLERIKRKNSKKKVKQLRLD